MTQLTARLEELKKLCDEATSAPWKHLYVAACESVTKEIEAILTEGEGKND